MGSSKTDRANAVKRGGFAGKEVRTLSKSSATSQAAVPGKGSQETVSGKGCSRRPVASDGCAIDEPEKGGLSFNDVSSAVDDFFDVVPRPSSGRRSCGKADEVVSDASRSEGRVPDDPLP